MAPELPDPCWAVSCCGLSVAHTAGLRPCSHSGCASVELFWDRPLSGLLGAAGASLSSGPWQGCEQASASSSRPDALLARQISIVELEKSQRQQELLQLKSCVPPDDALSAHLRGKGALGRELEADAGRLHLDLDCSKFSLPHFSSTSPELSINGHAATYEVCSALSRPSSKQNTPQYLASPLDQEVIPCTPSHSSRSRLEKMSGLALPDYTRLSPAKLVLRRHLSQDHAASGKTAAGELHPR